MRGIAQERIAVGASVLCRGLRVTLASTDIANGIAVESLWRLGNGFYDVGAYVTVKPVEGLGERDLHAMANAPLMDANRLFLPAGKLTEAEYRKRLGRDLGTTSKNGRDEGERA